MLAEFDAALLDPQVRAARQRGRVSFALLLSLAGGRAPRPKDLAAWPFIHLSRGSSVRQYIDAALHPQVLSAVLEVDHLATVSAMLSAGLGVSIVLYQVRRRDRGLSVAAQGFYDWVMARRPGS